MTTAPTVARISSLTESRPPGLTWQPPELAAPDANQPTLDLSSTAQIDPTRGRPPAPTRPDPAGVRVTLVRSRWCARQRPGLPDAGSWSTSLALALVEALHGHRPIAQLNRWVDDEVLAAIALHRRRRRADQGRLAARPVLRSVRLQHAAPDVAEVSAHLSIGRRSAAIAFRLGAVSGRWLCTAAEFGPRC